MISGTLHWRTQKWKREYRQSTESYAFLRTSYLKIHSKTWASKDEGGCRKVQKHEKKLSFPRCLLNFNLGSQFIKTKQRKKEYTDDSTLGKCDIPAPAPKRAQKSYIQEANYLDYERNMYFLKGFSLGFLQTRGM